VAFGKTRLDIVTCFEELVLDFGNSKQVLIFAEVYEKAKHHNINM